MDTIMFYKPKKDNIYPAYCDAHWLDSYFDIEAEQIIYSHGYSFKQKRLTVDIPADVTFFCNIDNKLLYKLELNDKVKIEAKYFCVFDCYR